LTLLLGIGGLVMAVIKKQTWAMIVTLFFLVYYIAVSGGQIKFMRYILPLIPVLAIGVGYVVQRIQESGKEKLGLALGLLVFGGVDTGSLVRSGGLTAKMMMPDARDLAGKWLKEKGASTVGLVNDPWYWSPSVQPDIDVTRMVGQKALLELWAGWEKPKVVRYFPENPSEPRFEWDVRLLKELKPEFVTFSSFEYIPFKRMSELKDGNDLDKLFGSRFLEFKKVLESEYDPVLETDSNHHEMVEDMEYVQPNVLIWQRKKTSASP
jgi:hypothetical protein